LIHEQCKQSRLLSTSTTRHNTSTTNNSSNNASSTTNSIKQKPSRNLSSLPILEDDDHDYHDNISSDATEKLAFAINQDKSNMNHVSSSGSRSPSHLSYVDEISYPITSYLKITKPNEDIPNGIWPVFRMMDENGHFRNPSNDGYTTRTNNHTFIQEKNHNCNSLEQKTKNQINHNDNNDEDDDGHDDGNDRNIQTLSTSLSKQYPQYQKIIQSSNLFQSLPNPNYKSFINDTTTTTTNSTSSSSSCSSQKNVLLRVHRIMNRLRQMDDILLNAQRQGRISFYLTCRGEEGSMIGSASALSLDDVVLAQYREQGVLMWRGFTLEQFTNQTFTNDLDLGRGRQMPIHYGSRALNYHTVSSPLGTQLPQAVGVAYKKKLLKLEQEEQRQQLQQQGHEGSNKNKVDGSISIVYFGDGAASTTDFHAACNFAATLKTPMIFFCRNNGYAISTKISDQYASDGIVSRSKAYGMAAIRVDGNDIFAVHAATKAAREYAILNSEPVLIEAISYRAGHHSTSDDSTQYRSIEEVTTSEKMNDPLRRLDLFLKNQNWMNDNDLAIIGNEERKAVIKAMEHAERRPRPKIDTMFQDVYKSMPLNLLLQEKNLHNHMKKYPGKYD